MEIYLTRHGESVDDVENCYGGIADFPLTKAGRETAKKLANKLVNSGIEILYTSPYKRAYETATIIQGILKCELRVVDNLRERNSYGVLSGVNKEKAEQVFTEIIGKLKHKPGDFYSDESIPGAEPLDEFGNRVREAFGEVVRDATGHGVIGIVTHGNVTRAIYRHILGVKAKVNPHLLAITVIYYEPAMIELDRERTQGIDIQ